MTLRYLKDSEVTSSMAAAAKRILAENYGKPWGTVVHFDADGRGYIARLERHYHTPGGPLRPWGAHTGVSVLEETDEPSQPITVVSAGKFVLGPTSLKRLIGLDDRLVRVVRRAIEITSIDFCVVEGVRNAQRQAQLLAQGRSQTQNSRHLTGHAVDLAPWKNGAISWAWPDFHVLAPHVFVAAQELDVPIQWGGNWPVVRGRSFPDGPHWQIPWGK